MKIKNLLITTLLSFILCFSVSNKAIAFVFANCFSKQNIIYNAVATETVMKASYASNITEYKNQQQAYFDNLTTNFGNNYKGSCGYIALAMLLSYYDTCINDSIIPEQYDVISSGFDANIIGRRNSPGTLSEPIQDPNKKKSDYDYATRLSAQDYYSKISSLADQSLHAKLITIGAEKGYYNFNAAQNEYPCGVTSYGIEAINKAYLTEVAGLKETDYYVYTKIGHWYDSDLVRNYIITLLKANYPVLIGVTNDKTGTTGHICIAYDYDAATDKIYCHMGWGASTTHVTIESQGFQYYTFAMDIEFRIPHNHPQNYEVVTLNNNKATTTNYCICSDDILSIHNHSYNYNDYGTAVHYLNCSCGVKKTQSHLYNNKYTKTDSSTHIAYCVCGASTTESHSYTRYETIGLINGGDKWHKSICECGHYELSSHTWTPYNKFNPLILKENAIAPLAIVGGNMVKCVFCGMIQSIGSDENYPIVFPFE